MLEASQQNIFLRGGVVSPTPNPQTGRPGYPFLSGSSHLIRLTWLYQELRSPQHSFQGHLATQHPLLNQNRDTIGGGGGLNFTACDFVLHSVAKEQNSLDLSS